MFQPSGGGNSSRVQPPPAVDAFAGCDLVDDRAGFQSPRKSVSGGFARTTGASPGATRTYGARMGRKDPLLLCRQIREAMAQESLRAVIVRMCRFCARQMSVFRHRILLSTSLREKTTAFPRHSLLLVAEANWHV